MTADVAKEIFEKVKSLSEVQQREVLDIVEQKMSLSDDKVVARPIWEVITEISSEIPMDEWEKLPSDGSVNHDHYLYGAPKKY